MISKGRCVPREKEINEKLSLAKSSRTMLAWAASGFILSVPFFWYPIFVVGGLVQLPDWLPIVFGILIGISLTAGFVQAKLFLKWHRRVREFQTELDEYWVDTRRPIVGMVPVSPGYFGDIKLPEPEQEGAD